MSNIELFYDHCAKILARFYKIFPVYLNFHAKDPDLDPDQISDEDLHLYRQKVGALHWLHAHKYITGIKGEWSLEDAVLSEKGMLFLRGHIPIIGEYDLADFRRAAENLFG